MTLIELPLFLSLLLQLIIAEQKFNLEIQASCYSSLFTEILEKDDHQKMSDLKSDLMYNLKTFGFD